LGVLGGIARDREAIDEGGIHDIEPGLGGKTQSLGPPVSGGNVFLAEEDAL